MAASPGEPLGPQVPGTTTLVYGSYHPVPGPAASATRAEVLAAWTAGEVVTVVSPRPSAAHLAVRIAGPLAARRLHNVRRKTGAGGLVFCAEAGVPLVAGRGPLGLANAVLTAGLLARAFGAFEEVTLVVTGDLGVPAWVLAPLRRAATEVRGPHSAAGPPPTPRPRATGEDGAVAEGRRAVHDYAAGDRLRAGVAQVSPLGPPEIPWKLRARGIAGVAARRLLGSRAPAARSALRALRSAAAARSR
ncbi:hypothetical protein K6U06_14395 [Acidiferrimicrobium sp. IK]|uniref:hypothetical protein n=1 Tax=Acidiferrimicrobium sp. IK TaxID=2871700 RepID=UPI0021CB5BF5|nr:hypothetical protein [Acidiferrimicrobium sp. IK]MCU4185555.1 hypothetical protein [Acidiferrimicrobium sp. IK]